MHLADDDPLRAVDDEGAVLRHQGDFPQVYLLLLHLTDAALLGLLIVLIHRKAQHDAQRRDVGHPSLAAFIRLVLLPAEDLHPVVVLHAGAAKAGIFVALRLPDAYFIAEVFERYILGGIGDGEDAAKHALETLVRTALGRQHFPLEESFVGRQLNVDQIRNIDNRRYGGEILTNPTAVLAIFYIHVGSPHESGGDSSKAPIPPYPTGIGSSASRVSLM